MSSSVTVPAGIPYLEPSVAWLQEVSQPQHHTELREKDPSTLSVTAVSRNICSVSTDVFMICMFSSNICTALYCQLDYTYATGEDTD